VLNKLDPAYYELKREFYTYIYIGTTDARLFYFPDRCNMDKALYENRKKVLQNTDKVTLLF
jgi:hypothetical protein